MATSIHTDSVSTVSDGVLNVNKAIGWTSHDVVAKLRGLLGLRRIGHAGTLDPAATGVLPVLLGKGTRIAEYLLKWDKAYRAVLRPGETTDTQDATGTILSRRSTTDLSPASVREVVSRFQGKLRQLPPMYSAVKVQGVPLYKSARAGRTVERGPREVTVHENTVLDIAGRDVTIRVVCSKGTYVRTLCADIGEALGVGGHLLSLERTRVGPLSIQSARTVTDIQSDLELGVLGEALLSLDHALDFMPALVVDETASARVVHGVPVPITAVCWDSGAPALLGLAGQTVRLKAGDGQLLALATVPETCSTQRAEDRSSAAVLPIAKVLVDR